MLARMWRKGTLFVECKMVQSQLRTVWKCLKKLKTELPYNQAISLLGIHLKKMKSLFQRGICTLMFMAALFITAKIRKQLKYPRWMDKENLALTHTHEHMYTHTHEYYSAIKEWNPAICNNIMDLDSTLLSEII